MRLYFLSVTLFISGRAFYLQQCKGYPLLFLDPKDNNDFSHCSFIKNVLPPPMNSILMCIPLELPLRTNKARNCDLIKKNVYNYVNCDSS